MSPMLLGPIFEFGGKLIDRWFPDPEKKAQAEMELFKIAQEGDLKLILAQLEINAREAQSPTIWVAGWRPAVGWAGATGFFYVVLVQPFLTWIGAALGWMPPPELNTDLLLTVLGGLLGIGGLRTVEKLKGAAAK